MVSLSAPERSVAFQISHRGNGDLVDRDVAWCEFGDCFIPRRVRRASVPWATRLTMGFCGASCENRTHDLFLTISLSRRCQRMEAFSVACTAARGSTRTAACRYGRGMGGLVSGLPTQHERGRRCQPESRPRRSTHHGSSRDDHATTSSNPALVLDLRSIRSTKAGVYE